MQKILLIFFYFLDIIFVQEISAKPKPRYSTTNLDSSVKEVHWCGSPSNQSLLVLTEKASIYKSSDKGFTWRKINDNLYKLLQDPKEKTDVNKFIRKKLIQIR